ncbi:protein STICHEL-like isoform X2 [Hibiscus syriacus]|nr:protein STICHEL-like isoform X2 [Hibiscus syriacus]
MSDVRMADPSRLHLKKELTQIRKAARVLRDPGTTSSWKSRINSSRSVAAVVEATDAGSTSACTVSRNHLGSESLNRSNVNAHLDLSLLPFRVESNSHRGRSVANGNEKDKRVFLYNWRSQNSSSLNVDDEGDDDGDDFDDGDDGDQSSSWIQGSVDENTLSDARKCGDSKSDTCLGESRSASLMFRCRDANPILSVTPSGKRMLGVNKNIKKNSSSFDVFPRCEQKKNGVNRNSVHSRKLLKAHPALALGLGRGNSVDQSDDTEDYSNSQDFRKILGASPLLLKLKHKNWSHSSSRLLRTDRREDSSYTYSTPALSTSSFKKYFNRNPSVVGSWDATTTSLNDRDDEVEDPLDLPGEQGCGIPCYWTKRTPKHRVVCGSCYSPSLSDTLRRKGSSILCGSQSMYHRHRRSVSLSNKRKIALRSAQGVLPLLSNSADGRGGSSIGTRCTDDELSTNFGEQDLEALSRLDGKRWSSSCRSQDGLEIVALTGETEEGTPENIKSLSQKYKPMFFDELIGQNIVVQSLVNAVSKGRIAPFYLFQGPRGTGKSSAARILSAALNCQTTKDVKPCGYCTECTEFISGKQREFWEFDSTNRRGIDRLRYLLKSLLTGLPSSSSRYKVFVIDECHLLPSKIWLAFLKFLEDPPPCLVFIFITTDIENVPRTVQSRCQKYLFNKIKDDDIVARLRKMSTDENLDVESDALDLIALNAYGSLRDAETMLDQLSLLGKRITASLVNELVGVVSDEKLLELLELAMSSDTAETVKRARELMDSGVDPMFLMSQLASLIMDIIAGTYNIADSKYSNSFFGGRALTEAEMERLKDALKLLSEAEKQLRFSSERSTWFTATLLQLGSLPSPDLTQSGSSQRQSSKTTVDDLQSISREAIAYKLKSGTQCVPWKSTSASLHKSVNGNSNRQGELVSRIDGYGSNSKNYHGLYMDGGAVPSAHDNSLNGNMILVCRNSEKLDDIWAKCINKCHSKTLRQLLHAHGRLLSLTENEAGVLIAYLAFADGDIKSRAERFLSSITNSIEIVMRRNVEVRIILLADVGVSLNNHANPVEMPDSLQQVETATGIGSERKAIPKNVLDGLSSLDLHSKGSFGDLEGKLRGLQDYSNYSSQSIVRTPELLAEGKDDLDSSKESRQDIPMQRIESIIREQRLETAWLQAAEKGTAGSLSRLKPEKNQVLPQEVYRQSNLGSINSSAFSSQQWDEELNQELKILKTNDVQEVQKDQIGRRADHYPMSPSLLHNSNLSKENIGYESGSGTRGCSGLFCWNNSKPPRRGKVKGTPVRSCKTRQFSLFGECGKSKKIQNKSRR